MDSTKRIKIKIPKIPTNPLIPVCFSHRGKQINKEQSQIPLITIITIIPGVLDFLKRNKINIPKIPIIPLIPGCFSLRRKRINIEQNQNTLCHHNSSCFGFRKKNQNQHSQNSNNSLNSRVFKLRNTNQIQINNNFQFPILPKFLHSVVLLKN